MLQIREAIKEDLAGLLNLYAQLHKGSKPVPYETALPVWEKILGSPAQHVIVGVSEESVVTSCVITVVSNLTHGLRPYALIENVITGEACRGRGYASRALHYAKEIAIRENCYKIMLLTGSKEESTLSFYERAGYNRRDKTAFIQWLD